MICTGTRLLQCSLAVPSISNVLVFSLFFNITVALFGHFSVIVFSHLLFSLSIYQLRDLLLQKPRLSWCNNKLRKRYKKQH